MYNCADDVRAYHDEEVTLLQADRDMMRERRNTNRDRLKKGLSDKDKPAPKEFKSQGSYAMKTMVQHPDKDYDIDDGVYFNGEAFVGERGGEMTSLQARQMVCDALADGSFKTPPEARKHCVRIYYAEGYHVDMPVYRRVSVKDDFGNETFHYELASSEWKRSDARDVTAWFEGEVAKRAKLRRITRLIKKYARSRPSWEARILSGFGITKLIVEEFRDADREDQAVHDTMKAMRDRLNGSLVVQNPVTPGETITDGENDPKASFFRDKLTEAIDNLAPLFESNCTQEKALKCWDKVFNATYFGKRSGPKSSPPSGPTGLAPGIAGVAAASQDAVRRRGGGRYA